ncbi:MAG TPA: chitobiase/beta-hexosaminidase C-terminal domain-containing protein [Nocardioidaceae bacterium]|nr:chitobiase/beta-hexosaminidase C-terminal domain-containing protein [Nocardioidaceae bacterium]
MNESMLDVSKGDGASARRRSATARLLRASAFGVLTCAVAAGGVMLPAGAAVNGAHTVFVLKNDSIVEAEGFADGENVLVEVKRDGIVVGSVERPASIGGTLIINHDFCWDGVTPEILPGDVVEVTSTTGTDTVAVADIDVTQGPVLAGNRFTIKGRVNGPRLPVGQLQVEARTEDPIRFRPLAPDTVDGVVGTIRYDRATGGDFTATFTGLSAAQRTAVGNFGEFFVTHAPAANEMTMATDGRPVAGPGCSVEAPIARRAVTGLSVPAVNARNVGQGLTVRGTTHNSSAVTVTLTDDDPATTGAAPVADADLGTVDAKGRASWTASFSAQDLSALNGTVTAAATHVDTATSTPLGGVDMSLVKDTVAPNRPSATPRRGTYSDPQSVRLTAAPGDQIRYTLGGGTQAAPTESTGFRYVRPVEITASQTLKAVAVDEAGNVSRVAQAAYRIGAAPGKPRIRDARSGKAGGRATAVVRWRPPLVNNGSRVTGYRVTALKLRRNGSVAKRRSSAVLSAGTRSNEMRLRRGRYQFMVRAINAFGASRMSVRSNVVAPR